MIMWNAWSEGVESDKQDHDKLVPRGNYIEWSVNSGLTRGQSDDKA